MDKSGLSFLHEVFSVYEIQNFVISTNSFLKHYSETISITWPWCLLQTKFCYGQWAVWWLAPEYNLC